MSELGLKKVTRVDHDVGRRIATLRKARRISQTVLGQALGVSFQQVQKYETGRNRVAAASLKRIAELLDVPMSVFFADDPHALDIVGRSVRSSAAHGAPLVTEALALMTAYGSIADEQLRRELVALAQSVARVTNEANTGRIASEAASE